MEQLRELIARVARSQAPVHISGESGTGKELVARLIHETARAPTGPFVPVNCGAIPTELMESEFFGHKQGQLHRRRRRQARPGAGRRGRHAVPRRGRGPAAAHAGQAAARDPGEGGAPVGEQREQPVDVRILSATHKTSASWSPPAASARTSYYRINVIELRVPPLRERATTCPSSPRPCWRACRAGGQARRRARARCAERLLGLPLPRQRPRAREHPRARADAVRGRRITAADIQLRPATGRKPPRRRGPPAYGRRAPAAPRRAARGHRARRHRPRARADPLQQDRGRQAARHHLPRAALPDQEARHRVTGDAVRHFVTRYGSGAASCDRCWRQRRNSIHNKINDLE
jgi:two-component system, NtrC family, response regulator PilR